jgi:hypothetical protein
MPILQNGHLSFNLKLARFNSKQDQSAAALAIVSMQIADSAEA